MVLKVESDGTAKVEWEHVCKNRMEATAKEEGITELQLAEKLQREAMLYEWGLMLYHDDAELVAPCYKNKIGFEAWKVFFNACREANTWRHLMDTDSKNGMDVIAKVIKLLRQSDRTLSGVKKDKFDCGRGH